MSTARGSGCPPRSPPAPPSCPSWACGLGMPGSPRTWPTPRAGCRHGSERRRGACATPAPL
eukprot:8573834-Alexandrium_andersonii.AAC.1